MKVKKAARLFFGFIACLAFYAFVASDCAAQEHSEAGFEIKEFELTGNSAFSSARLREVAASFTGPGKTADDVEKARDAIEKFYHDAGYPAVMVNIPEQTVKDGTVRLSVVESWIGRVNITGNRYFTMENLMESLPSLRPGVTPYLPDIQKELSRLNRKEDLKIEPLMSPGREFGTIDVELKVEDRLPLHGYLEISNKASHNTEELRLNAMVRYDNLWQKGHSISLQYQTAPQDLEEVQVLGGSYVLPSPWREDHQLALYAIWSDSATAFGEGFEVIGKGSMVGGRYVMPLPAYKLYVHYLTLGADYKDFDQAVGFTTGEGETTYTSVSYMPFSLLYNSSLPDQFGGITMFSAGVNVSLRGVGSDESEFELKRYHGTASYIYATVGVERTQKLPLGMGLFAKLDGQISGEPLIDNEQYTAGGMESVRGYKESESSVDNAAHATIEVSFPDPVERFGLWKSLQATPFLFYDVAHLVTKEPLPGQDRSVKLEGAGAGVRGTVMKNIEYELDWAVALEPTDRVKRNGQRFYFKVKAVF